MKVVGGKHGDLNFGRRVGIDMGRGSSVCVVVVCAGRGAESDLRDGESLMRLDQTASEEKVTGRRTRVMVQR